VKSIYRRVSDRDFSFIEKYSESKDVNIESFNIEIEPDDWQKIVHFRETGANNTTLPITEEMQEKVNALFTYNNEITKSSWGLLAICSPTLNILTNGLFLSMSKRVKQLWA
jgi:hypothetical protein